MLFTYFMALDSFYTVFPENIKKLGFLMSSGGTEKEQWHEMG